VRKFTPPIPSATSAPNAIKYATPERPSPYRQQRAFTITLIVSLGYFAVLVALELSKLDNLRQLFDIARQFPPSESYTIDFWAYILVLPAMTLIALLPVLACAFGLFGRRARGPTIAYLMLQVTLIIIHWVAATNLVRHGHFTYSRGGDDGASSIFVVYSGVLRTMPTTHIIFSLPLLASPALLVPAVRRIFSRS
jgi:hypothetical protein